VVPELPGDELEGSDAGQVRSTVLEGDKEWRLCSDKARGESLYTAVDLDQGNGGFAGFAAGAEIVGLQQGDKAGCMTAAVVAKVTALTDAYRQCPAWLKLGLAGVFKANEWSAMMLGEQNSVLGKFFSSHSDEQEAALRWAELRAFDFDPKLFDAYTASMYGLLVHKSLREYRVGLLPATDAEETAE